MTTQTYRRARHSVSLLQAHLVFVTKYRRKVFTDAMLTYCQTTMNGVCADLDAELVEFNGEADHVHLLVAYPPTVAIPQLVQRLKGRTAYTVRREFTGACVRARMRGHLWSPLISRSPAAAPHCRSSSNTSTDKPDHSDRRVAPAEQQDGLTPD